MSFGQPPQGGGGFGPPGGGGYGPPPGGDPFGQPPPGGGGFVPPSGDPGMGGAPPKNDPMALASIGTGGGGLVLSFLGLCCCVGYLAYPLALVAIVTGVLSLQRQKKEPHLFGGRQLALAGIGLGAATIVIAIIVTILGVVLGLGGQMMQNQNF